MTRQLLWQHQQRLWLQHICQQTTCQGCHAFQPLVVPEKRGRPGTIRIHLLTVPAISSRVQVLQAKSMLMVMLTLMLDQEPIFGTLRTTMEIQIAIIMQGAVSHKS